MSAVGDEIGVAFPRDIHVLELKLVQATHRVFTVELTDGEKELLLDHLVWIIARTREHPPLKVEIYKDGEGARAFPSSAFV